MTNAQPISPQDRRNRLILPLTPQTWVRTTQNAKTIFRIPEDQLQEASLRYKKRLIKYSEYKISLLGMAKAFSFNLDRAGTAVYFFIPIPKRWSKAKRNKFHLELHDAKPDLSNFLKAFEDALLPKQDQVIGHYAGLGKYWVDTKTGTKRDAKFGGGWIEIHMNQPVYQPRIDTILK